MSGHSRWANIKHKKGAADKKKGKVFSRMSKEIMVAVKVGGADPDTNARLNAAIIAARAVNMPTANVERAIKKASGEGNTSNYEEIVYEGYGPEGVAILIECLSDNRNRTAGEIRMIFDRNGANMANSGAVTWMFHRKCHFVITGENATEEKLFELAIEAGAEDLEVEGEVAEIWGPVEAFVTISKALEKAKIEVQEAGLSRKAETSVTINDPEKAKKLLNLIEKFEDQDDVQAVHTNFDIPEKIMETIQVE